MTLDDVMKLEGRELDAAVARIIGYRYLPDLGYTRLDGTYVHLDKLPAFSTDWNAAMQVREWARGLDGPAAVQYFRAVMDCLSERTRAKTTWGTSAVEWIEPIDYARAALLVSP